MDDQMADALRMPHRVLDGNRCALRNAQQRKALEPGGVRDALQVVNLVLEAQAMYRSIPTVRCRAHRIGKADGGA